MRGTTIGSRLLMVAFAGLLLFGVQAIVELNSRGDQLHAEASAQAQLLAQIAAGEISDAIGTGDLDFGSDIQTPQDLCDFVQPFAGAFSAVVRSRSGEEVCRFGDDAVLAALADPLRVVAISDTLEFVESADGWLLFTSLSTPAGEIIGSQSGDPLEPSGLLAERDDIEVLLVLDEEIFGQWPAGNTALGTSVAATDLPESVLTASTSGTGLDGTQRIFAAVPLPVGSGTVVVGLDDAEVTQAVASTRRDAILTLGFGAVAMLTLVLFVSRSIANPIHRFAARLRTHDGAPIALAEVSGPREVRELVERFNTLNADARSSTERLQYLAHNDPLTGLANRVRLTELLAHELQHSDRSDAVLVVHADLDDFSGVNQSYGSNIGDRFLTEVGHRLATLTEDGLSVGRLQGDEFAVFGTTPTRSAAKLIHRVLATLTQPVVVDGIVIECSARVGATFAGHGDSADEAFAEASRALEEAKRTDAESVIHDEELRERSVAWSRIANDLRDALELGEIQVAFQAIASAEDGQVKGVEALARWNHPTDGPIPPSVFIPVAERAGVIDALGLAVLRRSCVVVAEWNRLEPDLALSVSVNLSARQLAARELPETVSRVLRETGLPPSSLTIEVTESMILSDLEPMIDRLALIRGLGVRISLDDFGTGFSSLSYLTQLPVDVMKIDQTFVQSVDIDPRAREVLGIIAQLGHAAGLVVVCEGIETEAQLAVAREAGVDLVQGFLWHRPDVDQSAVLAHIRRAHVVGTV